MMYTLPKLVLLPQPRENHRKLECLCNGLWHLFLPKKNLHAVTGKLLLYLYSMLFVESVITFHLSTKLFVTRVIDLVQFPNHPHFI